MSTRKGNKKAASTKPPAAKKTSNTNVLLCAMAAPKLPNTLIPRPNLKNPLCCDNIPDVTILEAAAGFGKTCAAQLWLQESELPHCWLNLIKNEKWASPDANVFWEYLLQACQQLIPDFTSPIETPSNDETFVSAFLNALTLASKTIHDQTRVLVIDNYHYLANGSLLDNLDFISCHMPENIKLLLLSRSKIKLSHQASRLASGQLQIINARQLSFNDEESIYFLKSCGVSASKQALASISATLRGWPMGLKLASLSGKLLTNDGLSSQQIKLISKYLIEDVFNTLSQPIFSIVSRTVCLNQLHPAIIGRLIDDMDGDDAIDILRDNGIFVLIDENKPECLYQPLFAAAVRQHLLQTEKVNYLNYCSKAAEALEHFGDIKSAIQILADIEQWQAATRIIIKASTDRIHLNDYQSIHDWLCLLPKHWINRYPKLLHLSVITATKNQHFSLGKQYKLLDKAEQQILEAVDAKEDAKEKASVTLLSKLDFESHKQALDLLEEIHNLRAELARHHGNSEKHKNISFGTIRRAAQSRLLLGSATDLGLGMELYMRGKTQAAESALEDAIRHAQQENYQLVMLIAANYLAVVLTMMGRPLDALRRFDNILNWVGSKEIQLFPEIFLNSVGCVPVFCEMDQLEQAEQAMEPYLKVINKESLEPIQQYTTHLFLYHLKRCQGNYSQAEMGLANAQAIVFDKLDSWNWFFTPLAAYRAHIALLQGDIVTASQWANKQEEQLINSTEFRTEEERLILARILIKEERFEDTLKLLASLRTEAEKENRLLHVVQSYIIEAICYYQSGQAEKTKSAMNKALTIAAPCQFKRVFLDEGEAVTPLLQQAIKDKVLPEYTKLLYESNSKNQKQPLFTDQGVSIETLTSREVEILHLVSDGLRNKEMAEHLSISISTVKAHLYSIFSKIHVKSRTEAVSQGRKIGII